MEFLQTQSRVGCNLHLQFRLDPMPMLKKSCRKAQTKINRVSLNS